MTAVAAPLGLEHRSVRKPQQRVAVESMALVDGDADAAGDGDLAVTDANRRDQRVVDPLGHGHGFLCARQVRADENKLVAGIANEGVARPGHALQPLRRLAKQVVARRVTERVVDRLEVIEVDEHDGEGLAGPASEQMLRSAVANSSSGTPSRVAASVVRPAPEIRLRAMTTSG